MTINKWKTGILCASIVVYGILPACATTKKAGNFSALNDTDSYQTRGNTLYRNGLYKEAEGEFKKVVERKPDDSDAHYKLGVIYTIQGSIREGIDQFAQALSLNPACTKAYYNLGALYSTPGEYYDRERASIFFEKYLRLEPHPEFRERIEHWLNTPEGQEESTESIEQGSKTDSASNHDFRQWLKNQIQTMGGNDG